MCGDVCEKIWELLYIWMAQCANKCPHFYPFIRKSHDLFKNESMTHFLSESLGYYTMQVCLKVNETIYVLRIKNNMPIFL